MAVTKAARLFQQTGEALASSSSSPAAKRALALCNEQLQIEEQIKSLTETLGQLQTRFNTIKTKDMPEALSQLGTREWNNGKFKVELKPFVAGTLPKADKEGEKRKKAIAWIIKNGGQAIVKTEVSLAFGKQDRAQADRVIRSLEKAGFEPDVVEGVHPQTLLAFVREKLESGEDVDLDLLGLFSGQTAKVTVVEAKASAPVPKPKKAKA